MVEAGEIAPWATVVVGLFASAAYIVFEMRKSARIAEERRQDRDRIVDGRLVDICERLARLEGKIDGSAGQGAAGRSPKGSAA